MQHLICSLLLSGILTAALIPIWAVEETTEITDIQLIEERLSAAAEGLYQLSEATDRTTDSLTPENLDPLNPLGQRTIAAHSRQMIDAAQRTAEAITGAYSPIQNTIDQLLAMRRNTLRAAGDKSAPSDDPAIAHMEQQLDDIALRSVRAEEANDTFLMSLLDSQYTNLQALITLRTAPELMGIDQSEETILMLENTILNLQAVLDNSIQFVANLQQFSSYASNMTDMLEGMADTNEVLSVLQRITSGADAMNITRLNTEMAQLNRQVLSGMRSLNAASNQTRQQMQQSHRGDETGRSAALRQEIRARAASLNESP